MCWLSPTKFSAPTFQFALARHRWGGANTSMPSGERDRNGPMYQPISPM